MATEKNKKSKTSSKMATRKTKKSTTGNTSSAFKKKRVEKSPSREPLFNRIPKKPRTGGKPVYFSYSEVNTADTLMRMEDYDQPLVLPEHATQVQETTEKLEEPYEEIGQSVDQHSVTEKLEETIDMAAEEVNQRTTVIEPAALKVPQETPQETIDMAAEEVNQRTTEIEPAALKVPQETPQETIDMAAEEVNQRTTEIEPAALKVPHETPQETIDMAAEEVNQRTTLIEPAALKVPQETSESPATRVETERVVYVRKKKPLLVGYAFVADEESMYITPAIVDKCKENNIRLIKILQHSPLKEQGHFSCIIHKLHNHKSWVQELKQFCIENPSVKIVGAVEPYSGTSMLYLASTLKINKLVVPHQLVVYERDAMELYSATPMLYLPSTINTNNQEIKVAVPHQLVVHEINGAELNMNFPVLCKPFLASEKADKLIVLRDIQEIKEIQPPVVLQEFNGNAIFSVYVVGNYVRCLKKMAREDIKDVAECYLEIVNLESVCMPPQEFLVEIASSLRDVLKLELLCFTLTTNPHQPTEYQMIHIENFPSFIELPFLEIIFTKFINDILSKKV